MNSPNAAKSLDSLWPPFIRAAPPPTFRDSAADLLSLFPALFPAARMLAVVRITQRADELPRKIPEALAIRRGGPMHERLGARG